MVMRHGAQWMTHLVERKNSGKLSAFVSKLNGIFTPGHIHLFAVHVQFNLDLVADMSNLTCQFSYSCMCNTWMLP